MRSILAAKRARGRVKAHRGSPPAPAATVKCKYPFAGLGLRAHFSVRPKEGESLARVHNRLSAAAHYHTKKLGTKYEIRSLPAQGVVRVWRTR